MVATINSQYRIQAGIQNVLDQEPAYDRNVYSV